MSLLGWAAVLLLHHLALLHAIIVNVFVSVSDVRTIAVPVAVIVTVVTVMYVLRFHAC